MSCLVSMTVLCFHWCLASSIGEKSKNRSERLADAERRASEQEDVGSNDRGRCEVCERMGKLHVRSL